jgi:hypothetical protein
VPDRLVSVDDDYRLPGTVVDRLKSDVDLGGMSGMDNQQPGPTDWSASTTVLPLATMLSGTGFTSIYWPWIIKTAGVITSPLGEYYLYWSTDHDSGPGGIGMAYSDHPLGPWTVYGSVYADTVEGEQTETPTVIVRGLGDLVMFYHNTFSGLGNQTTCWATSSDGITWTRQGYAMNWPSNQLPGDGHTGYAKVYRHAYGYLAYTLFGGGDYPRQALWYSVDGGGRWVLDRRLFVNGVDWTGDNSYRLNMSVTCFQWRNSVWGFYAMKTPSSGGTGPADVKYYVGEMRQDMRGFTSEPYEVGFNPNCVIEHDGMLYAFMTGAVGTYVKTLEA